MAQKELTGLVSFKEIAAYLGISDETLRRKTIEIRPFLNRGQRKRLYTEEEAAFVITHFKNYKPAN